MSQNTQVSRAQTTDVLKIYIIDMLGWGKNKTHKIIQNRGKHSVAGFQCYRFLSSEEERKREVSVDGMSLIWAL